MADVIKTTPTETEQTESSSFEDSLLHIEIISQFPLNELDEIEENYLSQPAPKINANSAR